MNKCAIYLEFHVCISLSSKCQKFVSKSPGHIYYSILPLGAINFVKVTHRREPVCCAFGEQTAVNSCAFGEQTGANSCAAYIW